MKGLEKEFVHTIWGGFREQNALQQYTYSVNTKVQTQNAHKRALIINKKNLLRVAYIGGK